MFPPASKVISLIVVGGLLAVGANAQAAAYGQCGGSGWTGATTCVTGYTCVYQNDWYYQCVPGTATTTTTSSKTTSTTTTTSTKTTTTTKTTTSTAPARTPTVYLAGDSTMAIAASGAALQGWGAVLNNYISLPVVDDAVGGTSSRSFTTLGYFQAMYNVVKSGDIVVIEFGHNDGGGVAGNPGKGVCGLDDLTTTCVDTDGSIVYTFVKYLYDAVNTFTSKGCIVIVSSQTPNNPYDGGTGPISTVAPRFVGYAQTVASLTGAYYIDHFNYLIEEYTALGATATNALYVTGDHTHNNPAGALISAQAFIRGVLCASTNPLKSYVTSTNVVPTSCL
ncbi:carbohydrate esterase family 12 protein [Tulasnella calospora MUT 4182]|uniref:Carbohydrate esterase family 12 protein n=1 Tax=Tulasnella calospora MUT 4182 TaxID=1051891 RepID=A0A0C3M4M8_9AGAM|nr:carbohydrate esterase family 12 protein [Tulasnella calospora MUT 4182]